VNVKDNDRSRASAGQWDVGDDASQGEGGGDVSLCFDSLGGTSGEIWENQGERTDKKTWKLVNNRYLLENNTWRVEIGKESYMTVSDFYGIFDKKVGELIGEMFPTDLCQSD